MNRKLCKIAAVLDMALQKTEAASVPMFQKISTLGVYTLSPC